MSILSGKTIRNSLILTPCVDRYKHESGVSGGLGNASYDITLKEDIYIRKGYTTLAVSVERFNMPHDVAAKVCDKSTWARMGVDVKNTFIDPGWRGYLTLEIGYAPIFKPGHQSYKTWFPEMLKFEAGTPIAQVVFETTDRVTNGYTGKYQDQEEEVVEARFELG